jgi:hypothetical protein
MLPLDAPTCCAPSTSCAATSSPPCPIPAALGQRPLEVREAYAALEQYAADYGRDPLLLLMHAAVPETLRADLLNLIRVNFLRRPAPT